MKDRKLQIFVSSTFLDLRAERQAAVEAILSSGHIPAGMELFSAGDESQMSVIKRWINESDVYLLILGGRYGAIEPSTGKSYTQLEYEYAVELRKPLFAIVITNRALENKIRNDGIAVTEQFNPQLLIDFKNTVVKNLVKFWDDEKDIKIAIHETLSEFSYRKELIGWIRGDNLVNSGFLAEEIARLTKENAEMRSKLYKDNFASSLNYGGLSYFEMKNLLEKEIFKDSESTLSMNLFDFFINKGQAIASGTRSNRNNELFEKLVLLKLLRSESLITTMGMPSPKVYFFTDDGHNFYLKSLSLNEVKSLKTFITTKELKP